MRTTKKKVSEKSVKKVPSKKTSSANKMNLYRQRLRKAGLRPIQIWVPDTRAPGFAEELKRQSRLVSGGPDEQAVLDFIEDAVDWDDWK